MPQDYHKTASGGSLRPELGRPSTHCTDVVCSWGKMRHAGLTVASDFSTPSGRTALQKFQLQPGDHPQDCLGTCMVSSSIFWTYKWGGGVGGLFELLEALWEKQQKTLIFTSAIVTECLCISNMGKTQKLCFKLFLTTLKVHPNAVLGVTKVDEEAEAADYWTWTVYGY